MVQFVVIIGLTIASALVSAAPPRLVYSPRYSSVYYHQPSDKQINPQTSPNQDVTTEIPKDDTSTTATETSETETESAQIDHRDDGENVNGKLTKFGDLNEEAVYYIYHPDNGLLQRVVFLAKDDPQNMAYTAQFKYQDVEPIRDPIYTYDPNTFVLQRIQI